MIERPTSEIDKAVLAAVGSVLVEHDVDVIYIDTDDIAGAAERLRHFVGGRSWITHRIVIRSTPAPRPDLIVPAGGGYADTVESFGWLPQGWITGPISEV